MKSIFISALISILQGIFLTSGLTSLVLAFSFPSLIAGWLSCPELLSNLFLYSLIMLSTSEPYGPYIRDLSLGYTEGLKNVFK